MLDTKIFKPSGKLLACFSAVAILSACGGGSSSAGGGSGLTPGSDVLANTSWDSCAGFNNTSIRYSHEFRETTFTFSQKTYSNDDCSGQPDTDDLIYQGGYAVLGNVDTTNGITAQEINMIDENSFPFFDIIYIDNDVLYFGEDRAEFSDEDRSDTIDFDRPFFRR